MDHKTDPQVACSSKEKLDLIEAYRATYFISANKVVARHNGNLLDGEGLIISKLKKYTCTLSSWPCLVPINNTV